MVIGELGFVIVTTPETIAHTPVPTVGVLAESVADVLHTDWSGPALAVVGNTSKLIVTVSLDDGHAPLEIVHCKMYVEPDVSPVTVVVGELGLVIFAIPEIIVHTPVPIVGVLAASVVKVLHNV